MGKRQPIDGCSDEEVAHLIGVVLSHSPIDQRIEITMEWPFEIIAFTKVIINPESINCLHDSAVQFNGSAKVKQKDLVSKVVTSSKVSIAGTAFFAKDVEKDLVLMKICIDNIKLKDEDDGK